MISIDANFVDAAAPNAEAIKNGRTLVLKGAFVKLCQSDDETLIFGECSGSGKVPYRCSCDFVRADKPTHRCSCPSRQFPCKHCLGLMYAWVQKKPFAVTEVPEEISSKREKMEVREEKKKERDSQPRQVNTAALAKKIKTQLEALDLLEALNRDLVRMGMGNTNIKTAHQIEEQAKQLGNAYLGGAQSALLAYTKLFTNAVGKFDDAASNAKREAVYSEALDQLTRLHAIVKQGREYLKRRLEDPALAPETDTAIAAWLGHAWQLRELKDVGLVQNNVELVQLTFHSYDDVSRGEFVDTGIWMNLNTGRIQLTQTFRPYKAVKFIKGEDSFFQVAQIPELCVYPGDVNPRIRWESLTPRPLTDADYQRIRNHAQRDLPSLLKEVKSHLKLPLADKRPVHAVHFQRLGQVDGLIVMEDARGERLVLTDVGVAEEPPSCYLLKMLPKALLADQTLIVRFHHDLDARQLRIKPLAIVTTNAIVRLTL